MDTIASKREELEQFDTIGMETDTVKTQLDEYKVRGYGMRDMTVGSVVVISPKSIASTVLGG